MRRTYTSIPVDVWIDNSDEILHLNLAQHFGPWRNLWFKFRTMCSIDTYGFVTYLINMFHFYSESHQKYCLKKEENTVKIYYMHFTFFVFLCFTTQVSDGVPFNVWGRIVHINGICTIFELLRCNKLMLNKCKYSSCKYYSLLDWQFDGISNSCSFFWCLRIPLFTGTTI